MSSAIESPCINLCQLAPQNGLCLGCRRTLDEIAVWSQLSDAERRAIIAELPNRTPL